MHIGGQEHFYLETNITLAVPRGEDGEMELFVSTQSAAKSQVAVTRAVRLRLELTRCEFEVDLFQKRVKRFTESQHGVCFSLWWQRLWASLLTGWWSA